MTGFWREVFGNDRPVEVEIGSGTGTFLLSAARANPSSNFFGLERSRTRARQVAELIAAHGLPNARVLAADATCIVTRLIAPASVSAYHIYFPDPWWKRRHHRRRLFTPELAAALSRTLQPGGRVFVATDVDTVYQLATATLSIGLSREPSIPPRRIGQTVFERKGLQRGGTIYEAAFRRQPAA